MRKTILATAALVGLAGPALADMTLPAGDYPQAQAWSTQAPSPATYNALAERAPAHFSTGHSAGTHARHLR